MLALAFYRSLHNAAKKNNKTKINHLLKDTKTQRIGHSTILSTAIRNNSINAVHRLLKEPDFKSACGNIAFFQPLVNKILIQRNHAMALTLMVGCPPIALYIKQNHPKTFLNYCKKIAATSKVGENLATKGLPRGIVHFQASFLPGYHATAMVNGAKRVFGPYNPSDNVTSPSFRSH